MHPQICFVPFPITIGFSKTWTVFHTCAYNQGNLTWFFALCPFDFFMVPVK